MEGNKDRPKQRGGDHGGRKPFKYGEPTKIVASRIPLTKIEDFKKMAAAWLKQYEAPK